jgi:hypothetical protein
MRACSPLLLSMVLACGEFPNSPPTQAPDGGTVDAGATTGAVVYVAPIPIGSDTNSGMTKESPLATLSAALGLVESQDKDYEIHLCAGDFSVRNLAFAKARALRGGYNCKSWERGSAFGKKGGFADANRTRIVGVADETGPTLQVKATRSFVLEGVDVARSTGGFATVEFRGPSTETFFVQDARIYGAAGPNGGTVDQSSVGLFAHTTRVELVRSEFSGGAGRATGTQTEGSIAVRLYLSSGVIAEHWAFRHVRRGATPGPQHTNP